MKPDLQDYYWLGAIVDRPTETIPPFPLSRLRALGFLEDRQAIKLSALGRQALEPRPLLDQR